MIKSKDGEVTISGTGLDILGDFAVISAAVTETLMDSHVSREAAKDVMEKAFNVGMKEALDRRSERMPEMDEIEKAVNEFFDRFRNCLRDERYVCRTASI